MSTMTSSDSSIAADVNAELFFDPQVTTGDIRAEVINGRVTLTGIADTYATKWAAEHAAYREIGVRSVHNLITVDPQLLGLPSDSEITASVRVALDRDTAIPAARLHAFVSDGHVTLSGNVDWYYQRLAAEQVAGAVSGVRSVISNILITPPPVSPTTISQDIENALVRSAQVDAQHITVTVAGSKVTLSGKVRSWAESREAVDAAWRAKGVADIVNDIIIEP